MADISTEITAFQNAVYGEDVRSALISVANKLNEVVNGNPEGHNLGSGNTFAEASTSDQRTSISNGTFVGLEIGDYWTINNKVYRIADYNYWKRTGDTDFNTNHIVLVPDLSFGNDKMNATNTTEGGYTGSYMYTDASSVLNTARTEISNVFEGYLATHRLYFPNAVTNGADSAGAWFDSTVDLMNELMVYGTYIRANSYNGSHIATANKHQLQLFQRYPQYINLRYNYWLYDTVSAAYFAYVSYYGNAYNYHASTSLGVRPAFAVKGTA